MRWHGKRKRIYNCIDNNGTILVREGFRDSFSNVAGFLYPNPFRPHCLGNLGEVWILELHTIRNHAGFLLLDMDEIEFLIIQNDLNHRGSALYLGQKIAQSHHGETSSAAQCDALSAGICQSTSEGVRCR